MKKRGGKDMKNSQMNRTYHFVSHCLHLLCTGGEIRGFVRFVDFVLLLRLFQDHGEDLLDHQQRSTKRNEAKHRN